MQKIAIIIFALCLQSCKTKHAVTTTNEQLSISDIRHMQWIQRADLDLFDTMDITLQVDTSGERQPIIHYRAIRHAQAIAATAEQIRDTMATTMQTTETTMTEKQPQKQVIERKKYLAFYVACLFTCLFVLVLYRQKSGNGRP